MIRWTGLAREFEFPFPGSLTSTFLRPSPSARHPPPVTLHRNPRPQPRRREREFFIDNLLVRVQFILVMIRWTGLAPWEFEFPFPGSLTSTFLHPSPFTETLLFASRSAAHRERGREWGRLKAKVEPLLTLGNSGKPKPSVNPEMLKDLVEWNNDRQVHGDGLKGRLNLCLTHLHMCPARLHMCPTRLHMCPTRLHLCPTRLHMCPTRPRVCLTRLNNAGGEAERQSGDAERAGRMEHRIRLVQSLCGGRIECANTTSSRKCAAVPRRARI